jgi:hypothetical protein
MSDVSRYIEKRIRTNPDFAEGFEVGYANFKIGLVCVRSEKQRV